MKPMTLVAILLGVTSVWAADFSSYTTEELIQMKGTIAVEDRDDFRVEMQSRFQAMTPEERAQYNVGRNLGGQGQGQGNGLGQKGAMQYSGDGTQHRNTMKYGYGTGQGNGSVQNGKGSSQ